MRVYGFWEAPHLLLTYVLDRLTIKEIIYQTIRKGFTTLLSRHKKRTWPSFSIKLGDFLLVNTCKAKKEVESLHEMMVLTRTFRIHDSKAIIRDHCGVVKLVVAYDHEFYPDDSPIEGVISYDEVRERRRFQPLR